MLEREYGFLVGGEWKQGTAVLDVTSPHDGRVVTRVHQASAADLDEAVGRAAEAFEQTRRLPSWKRAEALRRIARGIEERRDDFSRAIALEAGKPLKYARGEVERAVQTFLFAATEVERSAGEVLTLDTTPRSEGRRGFLRRFPAGVVGAISPFNFPLNLVCHKVAPALAAGCTVVVKPASKDPTPALLLGEVCASVDLLPKGAVNVVPCRGAVGERLATDPRVKVLSFTGSAEVGWKLKEKAAKKKVTLELGGNAAVICHDDWDLNDAADRCVPGAFSYSGQVCISIQRIFVKACAFDPFAARLCAGARSLRRGDPLDEATDLAEMIDLENAERIEQWVEAARGRGAKVLCGGRREGRFYEATVLTDVAQDDRLCCEEAFGPVVVLAPYERFEDALAMVNASRFGLQTGLFTRSADRIFAAYEAIETGALVVGDAPTFRVDSMPYGGVKDSGFGREGLRYAIEEMTEPRLLVLHDIGARHLDR